MDKLKKSKKNRSMVSSYSNNLRPGENPASLFKTAPGQICRVETPEHLKRFDGGILKGRIFQFGRHNTTAFVRFKLDRSVFKGVLPVARYNETAKSFVETTLQIGDDVVVRVGAWNGYHNGYDLTWIGTDLQTGNELESLAATQPLLAAAGDGKKPAVATGDVKKRPIYNPNELPGRKTSRTGDTGTDGSDASLEGTFSFKSENAELMTRDMIATPPMSPAGAAGFVGAGADDAESVGFGAGAAGFVGGGAGDGKSVGSGTDDADSVGSGTELMTRDMIATPPMSPMSNSSSPSGDTPFKMAEFFSSTGCGGVQNGETRQIRDSDSSFDDTPLSIDDCFSPARAGDAEFVGAGAGNAESVGAGADDAESAGTASFHSYGHHYDGTVHPTVSSVVEFYPEILGEETVAQAQWDDEAQDRGELSNEEEEDQDDLGSVNSA